MVARLSEVLPPEEIWKMFSSRPAETDGRINFPYSRVDALVIALQQDMWAINYYKELTSQEVYYYFLRGSRNAFEALTWVEIGFQGLHNLATSDASRNWTSEVGHRLNDEERARRIMTSGKEMYDKHLGSFARYRYENNMKGDDFEKYGLEYLLEPFLPKAP